MSNLSFSMAGDDDKTVHGYFKLGSEALKQRRTFKLISLKISEGKKFSGDTSDEDFAHELVSVLERRRIKKDDPYLERLGIDLEPSDKGPVKLEWVQDTLSAFQMGELISKLTLLDATATKALPEQEGEGDNPN